MPRSTFRALETRLWSLPLRLAQHTKELGSPVVTYRSQRRALIPTDCNSVAVVVCAEQGGGGLFVWGGGEGGGEGASTGVGVCAKVRQSELRRDRGHVEQPSATEWRHTQIKSREWEGRAYTLMRSALKPCRVFVAMLGGFAPSATRLLQLRGLTLRCPVATASHPARSQARPAERTYRAASTWDSSAAPRIRRGRLFRVG